MSNQKIMENKQQNKSNSSPLQTVSLNCPTDHKSSKTSYKKKTNIDCKSQKPEKSKCLAAADSNNNTKSDQVSEITDSLKDVSLQKSQKSSRRGEFCNQKEEEDIITATSTPIKLSTDECNSISEDEEENFHLDNAASQLSFDGDSAIGEDFSSGESLDEQFAPSPSLKPKSEPADENTSMEMNRMWSNEPDIVEDPDLSIPNINGVPLSELSIEVGREEVQRNLFTPSKTPKKGKKSKPKKNKVLAEVKITPRRRRRRSYASSSECESSGHVSLKSTPSKDFRSTTSTPSKRKSDSDDNWRDSARKHPLSPTSDLDDLEEYVSQQYLFPDDQCGRLIGKAGKNVQDYKLSTGADIIVEISEESTLENVVTISGKPSQIKKVVRIINKRFDGALKRITLLNSLDSIQLEYEQLPSNLSMDVIVTTIVDAGHFFVHRLIHDNEMSYDMLQNDLSGCYFTASQRFVFPLDALPGIGTLGVVYADGCWCRVRVDDVWPELEQVSVSFIDTGAIGIVNVFDLRQIRPDLLKFPVMAIECLMSNIAPHPTELTFSYEAGEYMQHLTVGYVLRATVVGTRNGLPCVQLHFHDDTTGETHLLNEEMAKSGLTRWVDC